MRYRKLGRTNFEVSEVGYGAWGIGGDMWLGATDEEATTALRLALNHGINFFDTALAYGEEGHSERLVGEVLRHSVESKGDLQIYVATKVPPHNRLWPARPGIGIEDVFPNGYIVECTEKSLHNLGLERVDLQQLHVWNPDWMDRDEWKRDVENLKKAGKVRAFGVSINDHQPDSALALVRSGLIDTVQVIYNIFDQTPESQLLPVCREHNVGVIARVPFDEGALTGRINEDTKYDPRDFRARYFSGDRKKQVVEHVDALVEDLEIERSALPSLALRFILSNPAVSTVIPGMRTVTSVEENARVPGLGPLPEQTLALLKRHAWNKNFYAA